MEQYDVYSARNGLSDTNFCIPRGHGKLKRDKSDFGSDEIKLTSPKVPRHALPHHMDTGTHQSDVSAMSVLPRLLRTMANGNGRDVNLGVANSGAPEHRPALVNGGVENGNHSSVACGSSVNDADSSSSSSSFVSTPSSVSSSSIISFLTPEQLGPVAAMAAALSAPSTTTSVLESSESSGLVTLATASSMLEKEWLARTAFANNENNNFHGVHSTAVTTSNLEVSQSANDLITLTVEHGTDSNSDGSPPLLFRTLTSPHSQINGSTPVTRAVLNVQSLAAFIRETQKQRSASTTPLELPVTSENGLIDSCTDEIRVSSPAPQMVTSSTSALLTLAHSTHSTLADGDLGLRVIESSLPVDGVGVDSGSVQPTAFISLQPAPGSLLSSSDLQQLVASGEFMTSAARQTLLGQPSDGTTRQLYLLVPSDCPVIMSRASANQNASSPILDSSTDTAPVLEAISPGIEPEENCTRLPSQTIPSSSSPQPVTVALPQLTGAVLAPISSTSTALSTLIAGLEVRNHQPPSQQSRYPSTSPFRWSAPNSAVHTTDSSRLRLPIQLPGVSLSDHNILSTDQTAYPNAAVNGISTLLGAVKSDPDMYTPNGHPYPALIDDVNRFRSYPTYSQSANTHELGTGRTPSSGASATSAAFFQPDLSSSMLVPPPGGSNGNANNSTCPITNSNSSNSNDSAISAHLLPSPSLPRVNSTFSTGNLPASSTVTVSGAPSLLPASTTATTLLLDECRRHNILPVGNGNGRSDQASTTYLEHLNPESKDVRRRVSHNEVERRRRDRINTWISELYKLLPPDEQAKSQYQSKGIVLKRVCEYFQNVDSMLKAANAAVDQARVENGLLRQRNRELQQENQLLSASLHLGAAAAAAHLKNRQPRAPNSLHSSPDELNGTGDGSTQLMMKETVESTPDYPASVTVLTVNTGSDYNNATHHGSNLIQTNTPSCLVPNQSSVSTAGYLTLTGPHSADATSNVFTIHTVAPCTTTSNSTSVVISPNANLINPMVRPLTLPSLDLVANHTDGRPE
ncbi:hypothetical protein EG68_04132 [Paragonimus skrjabini miyazakii]|uniref:BHLH domain-containing protein n=1 Tax=Paragonimus skrjabini miyazakii TaxID=59628 RepID=A0A8S9YXP1_9TREM|nr:hypothetical protein EG68_04132 [Paragonimus skrjabini miyazakii]